MDSKQRVYINTSQVSLSINDVIIECGIKKDKNQHGIKEEDIDIQIFMSPQHAKGLMLSINQVVDLYEKMYGTINLNQDPERLKKVVEDFNSKNLERGKE